MSGIKIFFAGNNERGIKCFEKLVSIGANIVGALAVDVKDEEDGYFRSIRETVEKTDVELFHHQDTRNPGFADYITIGQAANLMILAGYPKIIKRDLFSRFQLGAMNLHASPLPNFRGGSPLNWAIIEGQEHWGISIIDIDDGIDTGDVILQRNMNILHEWTIKETTDNVNDLYCDMLVELLDRIRKGTLERKPQKDFHVPGSFYTKRKPEDGIIRFHKMNKIKIYNTVRALTSPYPGAFAYYKGEKVPIWKADLLDGECYRGIPGRVAERRGKDIIVICIRGGVLLKNMPKKIKVGTDFDRI